ncbi:MAG TPA: hypothetical protein EYG21_03675 [Nitrospinaceae bacterium]|nr:hypothetical protein [Nitrospinaceae bacterium]
MSSKVNYGKYRVNTKGLVFRVDGYSDRSYDHNTEYWRDLCTSGFDVKLQNSGLYDSTSGYYKFRKGATNTYGAISGSDFSGLRSMGVFKDKDSSFTIETFFQVKTGVGTSPDNGSVIFGNTDHNKSGYSYGFVGLTGEGGGVSGLNAVLASNREDDDNNNPWTGITGSLFSHTGSSTMSADTFYHAAMTYNANDGMTVGYVDGVAKSSGSFPASGEELHKASGSSNYHQFFIGGNNSSGLNVDVGMASCYNRALSSGEVLGNCKAVKHRYGGGY